MTPNNSTFYQTIETTNLEEIRIFLFYTVNFENFKNNIGKLHQSLETTKLEIFIEFPKPQN